MVDDIKIEGGTYVTGMTIRNPSEISTATLSFANAAGTAVTIHPDGRVEVNPKFSTDEAAQAFWDAVKALAPQMFKHITPTTTEMETDHAS